MIDPRGARNTKARLGAISETPSAYTEDATFIFPGGTAELRYTYEYDGSLRQGGIRFLGVRSHAFRAESQCTPWHIDGAYDELVEILNSDWLSSLARAAADSFATMKEVRHFLVYVDGSGAFEVAAKAYEWLDSRLVA